MNDLSDDPQLQDALRGLPRWEPPTDFAQRLAAAARRQAEARTGPAPGPLAQLLDTLNAIVPLTLAAALAAMAVVELPWEQLAAHAESTTLATALLLAGAGVWYTLRVWRAGD